MFNFVCCFFLLNINHIHFFPLEINSKSVDGGRCKVWLLESRTGHKSQIILTNFTEVWLPALLALAVDTWLRSIRTYRPLGLDGPRWGSGPGIDLGIKLFLTSLNTGLNFCNCCLSGSLKICPGPSLNARWCVSAQIKLYKQLIWWVLLNPMPGRAEVQVRAWLLNQEYNFKWTRNVLHWWLLFFFF